MTHMQDQYCQRATVTGYGLWVTYTVVESLPMQPSLFQMNGVNFMITGSNPRNWDEEPHAQPPELAEHESQSVQMNKFCPVLTPSWVVDSSYRCLQGLIWAEEWVLRVCSMTLHYKSVSRACSLQWIKHASVAQLSSPRSEMRDLLP